MSPSTPEAAASTQAAQPAAKAEDASPSARSERTGPARSGSARDGRAAEGARAHAVPAGLVIGGYLQAQYDHSRAAEDQLDANQAPKNYNRFYLRRARLRFDRAWDYATATLELDANNVRGPVVGVRRAEGTLLYRGSRSDGVPLLALSAGILDLPFGYELSESARVRPFLERSPGSLALFPTEMDAGVKVWGALDVFRYAVALTNGEPVDARGFPRDPNAAKDVSARFGVDAKLTQAFSLGGGTSFVVGKGFHAGRPGSKNALVWRDDNENGVVDSGELIGVPASSPEPSRNFDRWVLGLDLEVTWRNWLGKTEFVAEGFVASNYDRGLYAADPLLTGVDLREAGLSLRALQTVRDFGLVGLRYSGYDPNTDLLEQRRGNLLPRSATIHTFSALLGADLPGRARLVFQYDLVRDKLARDARGVPIDADNDQFGVRLQVEL